MYLTQIGVISHQSVNQSFDRPQSPRWFAWCEVWARSWKIANWCCFPGRVTPCFYRYFCFFLSVSWCYRLHGVYIYFVALCEFFKKWEQSRKVIKGWKWSMAQQLQWHVNDVFWVQASCVLLRTQKALDVKFHHELTRRMDSMLRGEAMEGFELITYNSPVVAIHRPQFLSVAHLGLSILLQAGSSADVFGKIKTMLDGNVQFGTVHSWHHNSAIGACNQKNRYPLGITHSEPCMIFFRLVEALNGSDFEHVQKTGKILSSKPQLWPVKWIKCGTCFQCQKIDTKYPDCIRLFPDVHISCWILMLHCLSKTVFLVIPMCQGWSLRWSAPCKRTCRSIGWTGISFWGSKPGGLP